MSYPDALEICRIEFFIKETELHSLYSCAFEAKRFLLTLEGCTPVWLQLW